MNSVKSKVVATSAAAVTIYSIHKVSRPFRKFLKISKKGLKITNYLVGKIVRVYNGLQYKYFYVTESMIGYKIGEFVFTKSVTKHSVKNIRTKKKKDKKKKIKNSLPFLISI